MAQLFDLYKTAESGKSALIDDRFVLKIVLSGGKLLLRKKKCNEHMRIYGAKEENLYIFYDKRQTGWAIKRKSRKH
jgi:hypothetical protein